MSLMYHRKREQFLPVVVAEDPTDMGLKQIFSLITLLTSPTLKVSLSLPTSGLKSEPWSPEMDPTQGLSKKA